MKRSTVDQVNGKGKTETKSGGQEGKGGKRQTPKTPNEIPTNTKNYQKRRIRMPIIPKWVPRAKDTRERRERKRYKKHLRKPKITKRKPRG